MMRTHLARLQLLGLVPLLALLLVACGRAPDGAQPEGSPRPQGSGQPMKAFSMKAADGGEVEFQPGTSVTLIEIWAPAWFEGADEQFRRLQEIYERYGNRGLRVLCVAYESTPEEVREAVKRHGALFDVGLADEKTLEILDPPALPTTWLVDREGRVLKRLEGYQPVEALEGPLEEALGTP